MSQRFSLPDEHANQVLDAARESLRKIHAARTELTQLGILRSDRDVQVDYSEWIVAQLLNLELSETGVEKGIDATDAEGVTYQVKSRTVQDMSVSTSFDMRALDPRLDYLVAVFFETGTLEVLAIVRVPFHVVRERVSETASRISFRRNRDAANDPRMEWLFHASADQE